MKRLFVDQIRGGLHAWEKFGYALANQAWEQKVREGAKSAYDKPPWKRQTRTRHPPELKNVLWGKLLYLKMVRGGSDALYTRLAERFNSICAAEAVKGVFAYAKLPVEPIVRNSSDAEKAIYVVEWCGDYLPAEAETSEALYGQGTAFAYKKQIGLVTCDHVLRSALFDGVDCESADLNGRELTVTCQATGRKSKAKVMYRDTGRDLALLQFDDNSVSERYFASVDGPLHRNTKGTLIGFPNWSPGRSANHTEARVLSIYPRSGLRRFEVSANIRQGYSGGPFVDELFRVAGVAQQGSKQDEGNDECLCVTELDSWLSEMSRIS